ncbi:hypothetical protein TNCV_835181 [Trichonephila clavipes]|nr:hypothetical protein TNCV_835181 [Trichonephila clavipes]
MYFLAFFLLTRNKNRITRKDFPYGNEQNTENTVRIGLSYQIIEEFVTVDGDNVCTAPQLWQTKRVWSLLKTQNIIDANSDDEKEMNNSAPAPPTSSEIRNIMENMFSYLNAHTDGEKNNKMVDIELFVDNCKEKYQMIFQKSNVFQKLDRFVLN